MAEVPFRPVRQLSEYKGKGASASRELSFTYVKLFSRQVRMRSGILQQLKDLKVLTEDSVLTDVEYVAQKQKLLQELQDL